MLTFELVPGKPVCAQTKPKHIFCVSHVLAQNLGIGPYVPRMIKVIALSPAPLPQAGEGSKRFSFECLQPFLQLCQPRLRARQQVGLNVETLA